LKEVSFVIIGAFVSEDEILGIYLIPNNFLFEFNKNDHGSMVLSRIGVGKMKLVRKADAISNKNTTRHSSRSLPKMKRAKC
jgi:hypothetical protein